MPRRAIQGSLNLLVVHTMTTWKEHNDTIHVETNPTKRHSNIRIKLLDRLLYLHYFLSTYKDILTSVSPWDFLCNLHPPDLS